VIVRSQTGILVPPEDSAALAEAIAALAADPARRRRMGEAGRLRVLDHFAIQTMVNRVAEVYEGAVGGDRVTP
jgi:type III pantothenate kinase